uniref:Ig-like domain-containing protein n=1 Tax=Oryzias melastigma TaxID=30732 RepID=A0A3B3BXD2_ORYME
MGGPISPLFLQSMGFFHTCLSIPRAGVPHRPLTHRLLSLDHRRVSNHRAAMNPSAEILEDSSVTLTCSSDANPAASYTWFKDNRTLISEQEVHFSSIRSEDSGNYSCKSENKHGQSSSVPLLLDVQCKNHKPRQSPEDNTVEYSAVVFKKSAEGKK